MVELYCTLIKSGAWKLEQVPALWRDAVAEKLAADKGVA